MSAFFINIANTAGAIFPNSLSNDVLIYTQSNSQQIIIGVNSNSSGNLVLGSNVNTINTNLITSSNFINSNISFLNSNVGIYNQNPQYALDIIGNINYTGQLLNNNTAYGDEVSYQTGGQFGTSNTPINGGTILLDTTISLSAIIELSSNGNSPLYINLNPTNSFNTNQIGDIGNIVIIERYPGGRSITIDSRIQFPTYENSIATGFTNTGFYNSTFSNIYSSSPPAFGGFAIDYINYNITKLGFGLGTYYRTFRCMAPSFTTISAQTGIYTGASAFTFSLSNYFSSYSNYFGPITYSMTGSPTIPSGMSIDSNQGIITVNQGIGYTGTVTVGLSGIGGYSNVPISFTILPTNPP